MRGYKQKGMNFGVGTGAYSTPDGKTYAGYDQTTYGGELGNPNIIINRDYGTRPHYQIDPDDIYGTTTPKAGKEVSSSTRRALSKKSELRRAKGSALSNRQVKRLDKGGAKAERQERRIRNKARRRRERQAKRNKY